MLKPLTGQEAATEGGRALGFSVLDFWRWSASDLVSNATRGVFAEFLVAQALGIRAPEVRDEWAAWDLTTPSGIKVEVKSAAYVQSWEQRAPSDIQFIVRRPKGGDGSPQERPADVYVFALLAHQDKPSINPLELGQWRFFALSARTLDARARSQHSITLPSLLKLAGPPVSFHELRDAVPLAAGRLEASPVLHAAGPTLPVPEQPVERGPWRGRVDEDGARQAVFLESDDFTHDVRLYVDGDCESVDQKLAYAHEIAHRLNAATPSESGP